MAQTNILFPEQERVAVGIGGQALSTVIAADSPHALDGLHKLWRLPEPVEVEGKLCIFNWLSSRNWVEIKGEGREIKIKSDHEQQLIRSVTLGRQSFQVHEILIQ